MKPTLALLIALLLAPGCLYGATGETGESGQDGEQGLPGPPGPQGQPGYAPSLEYESIYTVRTEPWVHVSTGGYWGASALCRTGDVVLSGGCEVDYEFGVVPQFTLSPIQSVPTVDPMGWACSWLWQHAELPVDVYVAATAECVEI